MQINRIESYNANQQNSVKNKLSFKGMYVIKGLSKDVDKAYGMVSDKCKTELSLFYDQMVAKKPREYCEGLKKVLNIILSEHSLGKNAPETRLLIATNEHCENVCNWHNTMHGWGSVPQQVTDRLVDADLKEYVEAREKLKQGDVDPMIDIAAKNIESAKRRLQEVRDLATVPCGEIKELNANDVINAIKEKRFDFITGEIKM